MIFWNSTHLYHLLGVLYYRIFSPHQFYGGFVTGNDEIPLSLVIFMSFDSSAIVHLGIYWINDLRPYSYGHIYMSFRLICNSPFRCLLDYFIRNSLIIVILLFGASG